MYLREGLVLNIPELSDALQLSSSKFEVTKVLDGGMGTCAQIKASNGSVYAIKMIHSNLLVEEDSTQRYIEELKKWLTLSACNGIVEALMIVRINEIPCIVSRWMNGGDLFPYVKKINKDLFYRTIDRIATTLKWAYEKHAIIHRDLKPQNILLDENQNAYVGDWGLAKDLSQNIEEKNGTILKKASASQTVDGTFMGTITYAAPEQILGKKDIDFRADIYSLGCMMYEWETGHIPFIGKTFEEIATKQIYELPQRITGFLGITKYKVEDIITKCLQKNPAKRYQSYDEFLSDFRKVASKHSDFTPFQINERYRTARIGVDELSHKIENEEFKMAKGAHGAVLIDEKEIEPYLKEAQHLIGLKEYEKAVSILKRFVHLEMFRHAANDSFVQNIVISLSFAYNELHKTSESIALLRTIENATHKPAAYYTNLGVAYMYSRQYELLKDICLEGLKLYPRDPDIQGNLTIAYTELNMLDDAIISAQQRLRMGRDVHSICEAASLCTSIAYKYANTDFPRTIDNDITALKLYREAELLNPNYLVAKRNIANILYYLKRYADSLNKIVEVSNIQHGSTSYEIWIMARNYLYSSLFKETIDLCDKYIPSFPDYIPIQRVRAQALLDGFVIDHYKDGNRIIESSSIKFYQTIVDDEKHRKPSDFKSLARYYIWMSEGNPHLKEEAFKTLERGKELYPSEWRFDFFLAAYYDMFQNPQKALIHAFEAIKKGPWQELSYNICAQIYSHLGDEKNADAMKQKAAQIKEQKSKLYKEARTI